MANIDEVQIPDGSDYFLKDSVSGYQTEAQVDAKVADKADKTIITIGGCSTAAATATKEVVGPEGWTLDEGRILAVKFVNTNTANNPTLKVGDADAKPIYYDTAVVTNSNLTAGGEANRVSLYQYDGTNWVWLGHSVDNNTTYDAMSASELVTGTATSPRTVRADYLKDGIQQIAGAYIAPVQTNLTAKQAYAVGEQFVYQGKIYKATAGISNGGTITIDGNCVLDNDVTALIRNQGANLQAFMPIFGTTKGRGDLTDALEIDLSSADGSLNKVAYVYSSYTSNMPSDINIGIREVYYYNSSSIYVKITGIDINQKMSEWGNYFNGTTWLGWQKLSGGNITLRTVNPIASLNGTYSITGGDIKEFSGYNFQILASTGHAVASIFIDKENFLGGRTYRAIFTDGVNLAYADVVKVSDTVMRVTVNQVFLDSGFGVVLIGLA